MPDNPPAPGSPASPKIELVEPGVVPVPRWRPDPSPFGVPAEVYSYCGVARKG